MEFICGLAHCGMHFKFVRTFLRHGLQLKLQSPFVRIRGTKRSCVPSTPNRVHMHPISFWQAFWIHASLWASFLQYWIQLKLQTLFVRNWRMTWNWEPSTPNRACMCPSTFQYAIQIRMSRCESFHHDRFQPKLQTPFEWNRGMKWNWGHTPRTEFIRSQANFSTSFESTQVGVRLFSTTGCNRNYKLHERTIWARNETACQTPRMEFICVLSHFGMYLKSVWVGVKLSIMLGSSWNNKLQMYEIEARDETERQVPRM